MSVPATKAAPPAWHSFEFLLCGGLSDTRLKPGRAYDSLKLLSVDWGQPHRRPKDDAPAFLPSTYREPDGRAHKVQAALGEFGALVADLDSGNLDLAQVSAMVAEIAPAAPRIIYSTGSSMPEARRWRVIVPLAQPVPFRRWEVAQEALASHLGASGAEADACALRAGQLAFLPNVPDVNEKTGEVLRDGQGEPLHFQAEQHGFDLEGLDLYSGPIAEKIDAIREERERQRQLDEEARERAADKARQRLAKRLQEGGDEEQPLEYFNARNSIADMLAACGYEQDTHKPENWRSPYQTSGSYATKDCGDHWVSLSGSDAAHSIGNAFDIGRYGDAFDLYVHFKHGGNFNAALSEIGREMRDGKSAMANDIGSANGGGIFVPFAPPETYGREARGKSVHLRPGFNPISGDTIEPKPDKREFLPLIDISAWQGEPPRRRSLWGEMLPLLQTTMLTGVGGVGKSLFEQMLCTCIALRKTFLGADTEQRNTLYVTCEDDPDELWRRQYAINAALGIDREDLIGRLHLCSLIGEQDTALAVETEGKRLRTTDRWLELRATCRAHEIGLYAFDNATDAMAGDHNDLHQVAEFVNLLTGLAIERDGAAMILHHPNKAGDDWLGSVAYHNKVRSRLIIEHGDVEADPDSRVLRAPKANYGPSGGRIHFRWHRGAFVRDEDLPSDYASELAQSIKANGENEAFLACLRARSEQGEARGVGPSPGPNYAPAQFEGMAQAKGFKKPALKRAMDRLFSIGRIEAHTYRNKSKGRDVTIIREVPEPPRTPTPNDSRTLSPNCPEQPARTTPHTHSIDKSIFGAATEAAAPFLGEEGDAS